MTTGNFNFSPHVLDSVITGPGQRPGVPIIETCHIRSAHEHTEEERTELLELGARWGVRSVNAYIELHEQPSARGRYTRIRHRRPQMLGLQDYALTVAWAGPAKTNDDIHAERASAEKRYEAEELRTAARLSITLAELRRRHWSEVSHLGTGGIHRLRRDLAWLRADVASPGHRMDLLSLFPDGADMPLEDFRFKPMWRQREPRSPGVRPRERANIYSRFPERSGGAF